MTYLKKIWQSLIFTEHIFSPKNGLIKVRKFFYGYEVVAGGCFQSGWYVTALWRKMLKEVPLDHKVKTVLMLGLGGGGVLRKCGRNFLSLILLPLSTIQLWWISQKESYLAK